MPRQRPVSDAADGCLDGAETERKVHHLQRTTPDSSDTPSQQTSRIFRALLAGKLPHKRQAIPQDQRHTNDRNTGKEKLAKHRFGYAGPQLLTNRHACK